MNHFQPIVAIATPKGESAIAVIRCSGQGIIEIGKKIFRSKKKGIENQRQAVLGWIVDPESNEKIDQVVLTAYKAPNSYTGEDMMEISTHGGKSAPYAVLELLIKNGCRMAEPGEFTRRAFLNEKMSLVQAEGIKEIIKAQTNEQRRLALFQIQGQNGKAILKTKQKLEKWLMRIEASLEFTDENIETYDKNQFIKEMEEIQNRIMEILAASKKSRKMQEGLVVPIVGSPNAGKSTLFNFLTQSERVIVDAHPGTTRDAVEEELEIQGIPIRLIDTAGIRKTDNPVEQKGIQKTKEYLLFADMILWIHDVSKEKNEEEKKWMQDFRDYDIFEIYNKSDLADEKSTKACWISLKSKSGIKKFLEEFEKRIKEKCGSASDFGLTSVYQIQCLEGAKTEIDSAVLKLKTEKELQEEIIAIELRQILEALAPLTGRTTTEEILDKIFSEFCIGK